MEKKALLQVLGGLLSSFQRGAIPDLPSIAVSFSQI